MISLQRLLGQEEEFFGLLEKSAQLGLRSIEALMELTGPSGSPDLEPFISLRRADKEMTLRLESMLITTFVTPIEREDLEALAEALYKIPKTVEKFAERYLIMKEQVSDVDFSGQFTLMKEAAEIVCRMLAAMREKGGLGGLRPLQNELQRIESHADDLLVAGLRAFYQPGFPMLKAIMLRDLYALNEKVVDRCRDAGSVISHVLLKNS